MGVGCLLQKRKQAKEQEVRPICAQKRSLELLHSAKAEGEAAEGSE
jgi:hypothetical protein